MKLRRQTTLIGYIEGGQEPSRWHVEGLPGPDYHWTGLGACLAAHLKERTGYDCGKLVWLPKPDADTLLPHRIVWCSPNPNEPIPDIVLWLWPYALVSVSLTARFYEQFAAASPAILTKASGSPWTVDATYNTASNTVYCVGAGGTAGLATTRARGGAGGGGGACVFASNYNNAWTPGTSTATFQVTGANPQAGAEGNAAANTTFDSSAFVARCGGGGPTGTTTGATGGVGSTSVVPVGGTKFSGGTGGASGASASANRPGGGGGGAGGTTGAGALGGSGPSVVDGGGGGAGADNGTAGTTASSTNGAAGGASGLASSTGGAGATTGAVATSGTLGAGGGGGCTTVNPAGANGSSAGTQFDGTHGAGGGGGGGGAFTGSAAANAAAGGNGGNYGGGGGGAGASGTSGNLSGAAGTGGDGIIFITWTAAGGATVIFAKAATMAMATPNASFPASVATKSKAAGTARSPVLALLLNLLGRGAISSKERDTANYVGVLQLRSAAQMQDRAAGTFRSALSAKAAAQGKMLPSLGAAASITAIAARSAAVSTGRALANFVGPLFGRAGAAGKSLPGLSASSSISSRSAAQSKAAPSLQALSALAGRAAQIGKGRAVAAYASALSARAAAASQARAATTAASRLLARGAAQTKAFGSINFGVISLFTRSAAVGISRALISSKSLLSSTSNAQAKAGGLLTGAISLFARGAAQSKELGIPQYVAGVLSRSANASLGRAAAFYKAQLAAISNSQNKAADLLSAVTALLARGATQSKGRGTINFGIVSLVARVVGISMGRAVTSAKAQLASISTAQEKTAGLLSATVSLLARGATQSKSFGTINFGSLALAARVAAAGMGRAVTAAKAQLSAISASQLKSHGFLSATTSLLARGAAQGKSLATINFGVISLFVHSAAVSTGRVVAAYVARLSTVSPAMNKSNGRLTAVTALLGRGVAQSRALPSLVLVKALTALSVAQSKGRATAAYTAQLGTVTAARLKASGAIAFSGQLGSLARSTAISAGRAALALLPPIVDPARLLVSAGKTRLLLAFGEGRNRLLVSAGKTRILQAYGEGRSRLISSLGKIRLIKR